MLNKFQGIGRLTRDPEVYHTSTGSSVTGFALALDESYKDKNDEWVNKAIFVECNAWNGTGTSIADRAHKGDLLYVEGKFAPESWDDKETGEKRTAARFTIFTWKLLAKVGEKKAVSDNDSPETEEKPAKKRGRSTKVESKPKPPVEEDDEDSDSIPF